MTRVDAGPLQHPVERPVGNLTLARFLLDQLAEAGVDTIFGIPGDFILRLCQAIDDYPGIRFRTLSHEPGVGFAACGAARGTQGLGVACVTYGAGALNLVNPIAAAYAEKTPVVVLTGGPGEDERSRGILISHQVKSCESQRKVFAEVTQYQAVLDDPQTAADQVRYALDVCRLYSLPVYLEVPRDRVDREIHLSPARRLVVPADPGAVEAAAAEILRQLARARRPVLVVGVEVHRQRLTAEVVRLAEALGITVASTFLGRGAFPDDHPQYAGVYLGPASPPGVRELVEESDFLLLLGALLSDTKGTNLGIRLSALDPRGVALAVSRTVTVGDHRYDDVPLDELVARLLAHPEGRARQDYVPSPGRRPFMRADDQPAEGPIRVAAMIAELNRFFAEKGAMPLIADTGDCLFCSHEIDTPLVLASAYYATMGFGVPAALGFEATTGRRPLVLVGDGGFQMTGQELAHAPLWGLEPIVVVMNNGSREMLQAVLPSGYNTLPDWHYAEVARLWGAASWQVRTAGDLRVALGEALREERPALIEVLLAPGDISDTLYSFTRDVRGAATAPP